MSKVVVLDLETTCKTVFDRTANPWYNTIVAYSIQTANTKDTVWCHGNKDAVIRIVDKIIENDILVAHNAKFELLYIWHDPKFQEWLKRGGKVYCTQLAEYIISNYKNQWASLRDIATRKYMCPERPKYIDDLLFKNKNSKYTCVSELPKDKVLYDVENDVNDTYKIYLMQSEIIACKPKSLLKNIEIQMDALVATTEMEYNGMYINLDYLKQYQQELETDLNKSAKVIHNTIKPFWKEYLPEFNMNSKDHLSSILYGGDITYNSVEPVLDDQGNTYIYQSGKKEGQIKVKTVKNKQPITGLGLKPLKEWYTKKVGVYKTNDYVLNLILDVCKDGTITEFIKAIITYRRSTKMISTYCDRFSNNLYRDQCYRGYYKHCTTITGRLTSNLQQIPKESISNIKNIFTSRFKEYE